MAPLHTGWLFAVSEGAQICKIYITFLPICTLATASTAVHVLWYNLNAIWILIFNIFFNYFPQFERRFFFTVLAAVYSYTDKESKHIPDEERVLLLFLNKAGIASLQPVSEPMTSRIQISSTVLTTPPRRSMPQETGYSCRSRSNGCKHVTTANTSVTYIIHFEVSLRFNQHARGALSTGT